MSITLSDAEELTDIVIPRNDNPFPPFQLTAAGAALQDLQRFAEPYAGPAVPARPADPEQSFVDSLEIAMLCIVLTGAAIFGNVLLRLNAVPPFVAHDASLVFVAVAACAGLVATWSTVLAAWRLTRLVRPPATRSGPQS